MKTWERKTHRNHNIPSGISGYRESRTQETSGVRMLGKNSGDRTHTVSRAAGLSIFPRELLQAGVSHAQILSLSECVPPGRSTGAPCGPTAPVHDTRGKEVADSTRGQGQGHRALQSSWVGRAGAGGGPKPVSLRACPAGQVRQGRVSSPLCPVDTQGQPPGGRALWRARVLRGGEKLSPWAKEGSRTT